jgi:hypothetical protein
MSWDGGESRVISKNKSLYDETMTFLDEQQIKSIRNTLPAALEYHFTNFQKLEVLASPIHKHMREDTPEWWQAITNIKFEAQAYLNQLRHIYYFLKSAPIKSKNISPPTQPELREVYDSIMTKNGMIYMLTQKWSAHRSYDDPREGDDEDLHAQVLLNLSNRTNIWSGCHFILCLQSHTLDLCSFHPKVINFLNWVFQETQLTR